MRSRLSFSLAAVVLALVGCNTSPKETSVTAEPKAAPSPAEPSQGALRLGAPIEATVERVSLAEVAKNPNAFVGKKFATTGTVSAVCQHMGCWMEIKDDAGEAHIKMAGHSFFVPKTSSGRKARVLATLVKNGEDGACAESSEGMAVAGGATHGETHAKGKGCKAEAEAQLGRPLAKLELVADGIELM